MEGVGRRLKDRIGFRKEMGRSGRLIARLMGRNVIKKGLGGGAGGIEKGEKGGKKKEEGKDGKKLW